MRGDRHEFTINNVFPAKNRRTNEKFENQTCIALPTGSSMTDLEEAQQMAMSFPGVRPPNNAGYIGSIQGKTDQYNYFKDMNGNYWFDTDRQRAFESKMEEKLKAKKRYAKRR